MLARAGGKLGRSGGCSRGGNGLGENVRRRVLHLPETPYRYADVELPAHFRSFVARRFDNTPADNPVTDHGATLGRALFYDTRLSANNTISFHSCHLQKNSFVDPNRASKGFEGKLTDRHAPSLVNLRYYARGRFFWDERGGALEQQELLPIQSKIEMGQNLTTLTDILTKDKHYPELFRKAFGDSKVTSERIGKGLAQFLRDGFLSIEVRRGCRQGRFGSRQLRELYGPGKPR